MTKLRSKGLATKHKKNFISGLFKSNREKRHELEDSLITKEYIKGIWSEAIEDYKAEYKKDPFAFINSSEK